MFLGEPNQTKITKTGPWTKPPALYRGEPYFRWIISSNPSLKAWNVPVSFCWTDFILSSATPQPLYNGYWGPKH